MTVQHGIWTGDGTREVGERLEARDWVGKLEEKASGVGQNSFMSVVRCIYIYISGVSTEYGGCR